MRLFNEDRSEEDERSRSQERLKYKLIKHVLKNTPPAATRDIYDKYGIALNALTATERNLLDAKTYNYIWLRNLLVEEGYINIAVINNDANQYTLTDQGRKARKVGGPAELIRREKIQWWMEVNAKTLIPVLSLIVAIVAISNNPKPAVNMVQVNIDSLIRSRAARASVYLIHDTVYLTPRSVEKGKQSNVSARE